MFLECQVCGGAGEVDAYQLVNTGLCNKRLCWPFRYMQASVLLQKQIIALTILIFFVIEKSQLILPTDIFLITKCITKMC